MGIAELKHKFMVVKHCEPAEANELLDFARRLYLRGEISLAEYRDLVRDLEKAGAYQPNETGEFAGVERRLDGGKGGTELRLSSKLYLV